MKCHGLRLIQRRQQSLEKEGTMALKNEAEVEEMREKEMDHFTALNAASDARSLFNACASLDDAANILENF